jgi:hypothetical protein
MKKVIAQISVSINFIDLDTLCGVYTVDLETTHFKTKGLFTQKLTNSKCSLYLRSFIKWVEGIKK